MGFKCSQILMPLLQTLQAKPIIITSSGLVDWDSADRELIVNEMSVNGKGTKGVQHWHFSDNCSCELKSSLFLLSAQAEFMGVLPSQWGEMILFYHCLKEDKTNKSLCGQKICIIYLIFALALFTYHSLMFFYVCLTLFQILINFQAKKKICNN